MPTSSEPLPTVSVDNPKRSPINQPTQTLATKGGTSAGVSCQNGQQHIIIQPIEFDYKHRNVYGYLTLAAALLVLINYLLIKERTCQLSFAGNVQNFDLIQGFHMTTLIVAIIIFVLSYFNFAVVIYEFRMLFLATAALIIICAVMLIYNAAAITSAPCVPISSPMAGPFLSAIDSSFLTGSTDIFAAKDGTGITVFVFDLIAAVLMFIAGRSFYKRS